MAAILTATFEAGASRVRLELQNATGAATATFETRLSGTNTWQTVRGGFEVSVTAGATRAVYDYEFPTSTTDPLLLGDETLLGPDTLTGGSLAEYRATTDNDLTATADAATDITDQVWLKFPGYPHLNRQVTVAGRSEITRDSRGQLVPIVATGQPVAVQEYMSGRSFTVTVRTTNWRAYSELDTTLSLGSIVFLHADETRLGLPSVYGVVREVTSAPVGRAHGTTRHTEIKLAEVSRPSHFYTAAVATLATLEAAYDTLAELGEEYATLRDLVELEGLGADVIVG